jgi:hypothetical protein
MPLYILKDRTYEILPNQEGYSKDADITPGQLKVIADTLGEYFGCFMLFGMSYKGEPRFLASTSSGMEYLALKRFAEDVVIGDVGIQLSALGEEEDDEEHEY